MVSESARRTDQVIRDGLAPALKAAGYRKDGRTFRRPELRGTCVVNVQGSRWNTKDQGRFTLNLGVYFPDVVPFLDWMRATNRPSEADCLVRKRIGSVMPAGRDHWWVVTPQTDLVSLSRELREAWEQFGAPWLDGHANLAAARGLALIGRTPYWAAAISLALGEWGAAQAYLEQAITAARDSANVAGSLRLWGKRHGLLPDAGDSHRAASRALGRPTSHGRHRRRLERRSGEGEEGA